MSDQKESEFKKKLKALDNAISDLEEECYDAEKLIARNSLLARENDLFLELLEVNGIDWRPRAEEEGLIDERGSVTVEDRWL